MAQTIFVIRKCLTLKDEIGQSKNVCLATFKSSIHGIILKAVKKSNLRYKIDQSYKVG